MNKKLKIKIILILLIIITIIKIVQINFIEKIRVKIEEFQKFDNTYYRASSLIEKQKIEINVVKKNKIIKAVDNYISINDAKTTFIDFNNMKIIEIYENDKIYMIKEKIENYNVNIKNFPKILEILNEIKQEIKNGNIFSIFNCFRILYISTEKYNDTDCYKIKTTRELLYVDKNTLYPVYLEYNQTNSKNNKEKIKIEYIFKENTVTDEDIKLPDLNDYKLIQN